jgi:hypothetical protein
MATYWINGVALQYFKTQQPEVTVHKIKTYSWRMIKSQGSTYIAILTDLINEYSRVIYTLFLSYTW